MTGQHGGSRRINIVIPTRNRLDVLRSSLATAVNQNDDDLLIHVSDNSDGLECEDVVAAFKDPRIQYYKTPRRLSMADNYEFALSKIEHGWIAQTGDDDGFVPNSLRRQIELLEEHRLQALTSRPCYFNWPGATPTGQSVLSVPLPTGNVQRIRGRDSIRAAANMMPSKFVMPQTYTGGIVSFDVVQTVRDKLGRFHNCQIPDYYSGFVMCGLLDEFLYTDDVFAIAGQSKHSIGQSLFRQEKNAFLEDDIIPFDDRLCVPENGTLTYSMPAIVFECYLKTIPFHEDFLQITDEQILETILAETTYGRAEIQVWGKSFAQVRGLDFAAIAQRAVRLNWRRKVDKGLTALGNFSTRYRIDDSYDFRMRNVYDASIVSDALIRLKPSLVRNYLRTLRRLLTRRPSIAA